MEKRKIEFFIAYYHRQDWMHTEGPFDDFTEAASYACNDWSYYTDIEKRSRSIEIYKQETFYDDNNEPIESEIINEEENEKFKVGQGYFMFDEKKYHIWDIDEYFTENDCSFDDIATVDFTSYRLGIDHFEKYIYTIYKAIGKDGKEYEVAITHDLLDGIMNSDSDAYTSEMDLEIQAAK